MADISLDLVKQLRERTGAGLMACKKALRETEGDLEKAIDVLRRQGASIAAKRSENTAAQGIVDSYIHSGGQVGVLVEINCETDFVARTDDMKQFARDICLHIAASNPHVLSPEDLDAEEVERERQLYTESVQAEATSQEEADKLLERKMNKFYAQTCLMKQPFIKDEKRTIEDVIKDLVARLGEKIVIRRFARYSVGEQS